MTDPVPETPRSGGGVLIFTLVALFAVGAFVLLNILSMGALSWVLAITAGIALVGAFHYLLWGHDLTQQVAEEREAFLRQQARERERDEGWRG
jgi:hypothetical protein